MAWVTYFPILGTGNMFPTHNLPYVLSHTCDWLTHIWVLWCLLYKQLYFSQGKYLVKKSMDLISLVGDAVIALRVPDEGMISIQTTGLTMTLGRHSPDKLVGLNIKEKDARFVLPAEKKALESSGILGARFVDTQVWILHQVSDDDRAGGNLFVFFPDISETCGLRCFPQLHVHHEKLPRNLLLHS